MADDLISKMKEKYQEMQDGLKRDIRPMMSRAYGYNPERDMYRTPDDFEHKPYPTWVHLKDKDGKAYSVIANNKEEHDELLGRKPEPAKKASVDITQLVQEQPVQVRRGRPPKAKTAELPPNLD